MRAFSHISAVAIFSSHMLACIIILIWVYFCEHMELDIESVKTSINLSLRFAIDLIGFLRGLR